MVDRVSALEGLALPMMFGNDLKISERRVASIWQITAWPGQVDAAGAALAKAASVKTAPGPLRSGEGAGDVLRVDPMRWLWVNEAACDAPDLGATGTVLDLSHARTILRIEGARAADLLAKHLPLDFRETAFPAGSVATSGLHHVAVTCHARKGGVELYSFRSFGKALLEHLAESAEQFAL